MANVFVDVFRKKIVNVGATAAQDVLVKCFDGDGAHEFVKIKSTIFYGCLVTDGRADVGRFVFAAAGTTSYRSNSSFGYNCIHVF